MSVHHLKDVQTTVEVNCNWNSNIPEKSIDDAILLHYDDQDDQEIENLQDLVNVKTTVSFVAPERHIDKPVIMFKIPSLESFYINSITLLCDSKAIETFGDHCIYLDTLHGTAIEETDEFYVYEYKVDLSRRINKEVSLKFVKPARPNCLWIYGILLNLKKINQNSSSPSINYDNVQDLLKNSHISDTANRAFSFLRDANTSSQYLANGGDSSSKSSDDNAQFQQIKSYIDFKFQILMDYLIMREKSTNDKLDKIIDMMKSKN